MHQLVGQQGWQGPRACSTEVLRAGRRAMLGDGGWPASCTHVMSYMHTQRGMFKEQSTHVLCGSTFTCTLHMGNRSTHRVSTTGLVRDQGGRPL
eukprot:294115-Pelagomonas_calceolata.AAC.13